MNQLLALAAASSVFWLAVTLAAYLAGLWLYQRSGGSPFLLPVITAVVVIVTLLLLTGVPYADYAAHARPLIFLIGPATVALAVPLHGQMARIRAVWRPVCLALLAGSLTAIVSAFGIAWLLGAELRTLLSLGSKSATMPVAMDVTALAGGLPSLTSVAVALTGISGAMLAGGLCRVMRIQDAATRGFALGVTAHAIGVARGFQDDETTGAFAALGMGLNAIATAILVPVVLLALGAAGFV